MKSSLAISLLIVTLVAPIACRAATASDADLRCTELFAAIQKGDFNAATAHFNAKVKSAVPPPRLETIWTQVTSGSGKLLKWEITKRTSAGGNDTRIVYLTFEQEPNLEATCSVNQASGEISGLSFKTPGSSEPPHAAAQTVASPPYANSSAFHSEEVIVGAVPTALGGTLTIPNGKGKFPAAVLVSDSGPHDRDEKIGANRPFKDIAEGLSSRGVAVLRFDKRTFAYPDLDLKHITVDQEEIEDAVAAVNLMKHQPEVDSARVFVIGHGLGAVVAPEIATKAAPVGGIVMLAPTARPFPQIIVDQMRYLKAASPQEMMDVERQANELMAGKMPPGDWLGLPSSYYTDLDARDEIAIARALGRPILILHGERDYQTIDADIRKWQAGLKGTKVRVESFPKLNHLFIAGSGPSGPKDYQIPGHVDVEVIDAIAKFIGAAPSKSASK